MRRREIVELILIVGVMFLVMACRPWLPTSMPLGEVILCGAALLLAQSLVRDLWIKFGGSRPARQVANGTPPATCMCMESTVGVTGVVAGGVLLLAAAGKPVELAVYFWPGFVLLVALPGFFMKDLVIDWKQKRLRREKDHQNVIFW